MLRIGKFAQLGQTTVSTVRFYDDAGLIKPVHIDGKTGYRYYALDQLKTLHKVFALKDLGLSLTEIQAVLHQNLSAEQVVLLLNLKRAEIEKQLAAEGARLSRIVAHIQQIERENAMPQFDIALKTVPAALVARRRITIPTNAQAPELLDRAYDEIFQHLHAHGAAAVGPCSALWLQGPEVHEDEVAEPMVPIDRRIAASESVAIDERPARDVAAIVGSIPELPQMHVALVAWMEAHGYADQGTYDEIYHPQEGQPPLAEIQYPLTAPVA